MGFRKIVLRGKFSAINACIKKEERFQINNLTFCLKVEKKTPKNYTQSKQKEGNNKIKAEINEIETRETTEDQ